MAFIRVQKLVRDSNGNILSGSAAIKESQYVKDGGKFHSRQIVRERLGKVVWLASDGKSGIFLSPSRGRVSYDSVSDSFDAMTDACPAKVSMFFLTPKSTPYSVMRTSCFAFLSRAEWPNC